MPRYRGPTNRVAIPQPINIWLMEKLPNEYAQRRRQNASISIVDSDVWIWHDANRVTSRMTERNKHHLYRVEIKTRGEQRSQEQATIDRDIDLVCRTHWPAQRTATGQFATGHAPNMRPVYDGSTLIQCYGSHLWQLQWDTPDDSQWMMWN